MKKIIITISILFHVVNISAQNVSADVQSLQSGVSVEWGSKKPKETNAIMADFIYKHLVVGGSYGWTNNDNDDADNGKIMKKAQSLEFHVGGNYRYFIGNYFFVEGRVNIGYKHAFQKYLSGKKYTHYSSGVGRTLETRDEESDIWKTQGDGNIYLGLSPRIGVNFDGIAIVAGYRWDFNKFKFDKDNTGDYFTVGLVYLF